MYLSKLQKYILSQCYFLSKKRLSRKKIENFYLKQKKKPKEIVKIITKSLERLIKKGLLIGYGKKTFNKWYIKEVKLTLKGKKEIQKHLAKQQKLPFK